MQMYAKMLLHPKNRNEKARLRRAENEQCFGESSMHRVMCGTGRRYRLMYFAAEMDAIFNVDFASFFITGAQIATKTIDEGIRAGAMAKESGATWLDLNAACPIYEATKRGMGARLLQRYRFLSFLAAALSMAGGPHRSAVSPCRLWMQTACTECQHSSL